MDDGLGDETQAIPVTPAWVLADRYRVLDRLGSGGMAEVFRAHDDQLDRDVAVKVFRTPVDEPGNATAVERREIELRALAQLSHPNLITLYDANIAGANPAFLVTELVIGPNLADRLTDGPLPEDVARTVGEQIADALAYVHERGMVHRDVKPANILLGTDGATPETATIRARLSDFGIVRVLDDARMTAAEFTLGTAFYIAPEQARGADVDAAADVYSLGLVLIEMLSGTRSFDGPMHEAMAARLTRSPDIPPGLPQPWPGLLTAMTQIDPAARPTAAEVAQSLRTSTIPALGTMSTPPLPLPVVAGAAELPAHMPAAFAAEPVPSEPMPVEPVPPRRHRGVGLAVAAAAFLAVIAVGAILIFRPSSHPSTPTGGASEAPTTSSSQSSASSSSKSSEDAAVPVTAGGSAPSSASSSAATSGAPSTSRASSSRASSPPPRTSTTAKPTSSTPKPSPSKTKTTTSAPVSSPATTTSAPASGSSVPATGGAISTGAA